MLIELTHKNLTAAIETKGAHLRRFYDAAADDEILWSGDPAVWSGVAPILFPVIGRLKDGQYQHNGKTYQMPKHGFARDMEFEVADKSAHRVLLRLCSNDDTLKIFPFDFCLEVTFELGDAGLCVGYVVRNTGSDQMYFTIGSHPAISLSKAAAPHYIEFCEPETLGVYKLVDGLIGAEPTPYLDKQQRINITPDLFKDDALIFKDIASSSLRVVSANGRMIEVTTGGAPHLGLWAMQGADYVCVEPWYSYDDGLDGGGPIKDKPGIICLEPDKSFATGYSISRI